MRASQCENRPIFYSFAVRNRQTDRYVDNKFLVSKETVVLRRWESKTGKFCFIKRVDKGRISTVNDLES